MVKATQNTVTSPKKAPKTPVKTPKKAIVKSEVKKDISKHGHEVKKLKTASVKTAAKLCGVEYQRNAGVEVLYGFVENSIRKLARRAKKNVAARGHKCISEQDLQEKMIDSNYEKKSKKTSTEEKQPAAVEAN